MNNYQWYPGHMAKALKTMREDIKPVDVLVELSDARAPESTRNPNITELSKGKIHILVLNKRDMADEEKTVQWLEYYKEMGVTAVAVDAKSKEDIKKVNSVIEKKISAKFSDADSRLAEAVKKAGGDLKKRTVRIMVTGIPNVGKSTFINSFAGKAGAKTGNRPGVTKGRQWIRLRSGRDLLDTPGVLYVKPLSQDAGMRIAFIGSLNDNNLNIEELALDLIKWIMDHYPGRLSQRYDIDENITDDQDTGIDPALTVMEAVGAKRGALKKGGITDYERTAILILDDFRNLRLGPVTLETPDETEGITDEKA